MTPVRVGVIGTGFGARVVAPVYSATPGMEVVEVVSARDDSAVAALCRRHDLDLVSVHSPPFLHVSHVRQAIEAGHAVLCEKPFGLDAGEAAAMLEWAEAAGVVHLLNFELRCLPGRARLSAALVDGVVGVPEQLLWTHHSAGSRVPLRRAGWLFDRARGGGWIGAWGSHAVDALRMWLGDLEVSAATLRTTIASRPIDGGGAGSVGAGAWAAVDAEDGFTAVLRAGPTVATLDSTFAAAADVAPRILVLGSEGVLESVADTRLTLRRAGTEPDLLWQADLTTGDRHGGPMATWAALVRDAVRERRPISPSFADGLACAAILDAIRAGGTCSPAVA